MWKFPRLRFRRKGCQEFLQKRVTWPSLQKLTGGCNRGVRYEPYANCAFSQVLSTADSQCHLRGGTLTCLWESFLTSVAKMSRTARTLLLRASCSSSKRTQIRRSGSQCRKCRSYPQLRSFASLACMQSFSTHACASAHDKFDQDGDKQGGLVQLSVCLNMAHKHEDPTPETRSRQLLGMT